MSNFFSPTCIARRKVREISICLRNCSQGQAIVLILICQKLLYPRCFFLVESVLHYNDQINNLPQAFSSEPSLQSFSLLQKRPLSIQFPSPHARKFSWHKGSSVYNKGLTFFSLVLDSQFLTERFQSQVCFSMSKAKPAGHRIAWRPLKAEIFWIRYMTWWPFYGLVLK